VQYFPQLFRTINDAYNDVITKTGLLGTGAAVGSTTQAKLTSAQLVARGAAGSSLTTTIANAASGLTKDYLLASIAANEATADKTQATADKGRAIAAQTLANNNMKTAKADVSVKAYLYKQQKDAYDAQVVLYTLYNSKKADFATAKTDSDAIATLANKKRDFYQNVLDKANLAQTAARSAYDTANAALAANTSAITAATAAEVVAVSTCKARGYKQAQDTLKAITAKETADAATAATVKTAYDKLVAASRPAAVEAGSPAGADCAYPAAAADGTQAARPKCAAELCCGAANKYLKDGSKLTIETCQALTATSYTYYPQLKAGATVAPATEQWRFSCISGAKNLAATATAALAAAYLMA